jgi:hypothetical protein
MNRSQLEHIIRARKRFRIQQATDCLRNYFSREAAGTGEGLGLAAGGKGANPFENQRALFAKRPLRIIIGVWTAKPLPP